MAINLKKIKPNKPMVNIFDFVWVVYGRPKAGKTSLFDAMVKEHFEGDNTRGLLIAFEKGYQALKGIMAQDVNDWEEYIEVVDQLVESAELEENDEDKLSFKIIGLDTIDKMYKYATDYVLRQQSRRMQKRLTQINDIAYGGGYTMVVAEMEKQIDRLLKAGYGLFMITHDTGKKVKSKSGVEYDQTTVSLAKGAKDLVFNMADFIVFIEIAKEKVGDDIIETRQVYFRGDGDIEAGSRFKHIVPKVDYDAINVLDAFKNAVEAEYANDKNFDLAKLKEKQDAEKAERVKAYLEDSKSHIDVDSLLDYIDTKTKGMKGDFKKKIIAGFKEIIGGNSYNYKKEGVTPEQLQQCANFLREALEQQNESANEE